MDTETAPAVSTLNSPYAQRRRRWRWWKIAGGVTLAAFLAGPLAAPKVRSAFRAWRADVWIATAEAEFAKGNLAEANAWTYKTMLRFPENRAAPRLLADICESRGSLLSIRWRLALAESTGYEREATLALARTAVKFAQPGVALDALHRLKDGDLRTAADWILAAEAAALGNQPVKARAALECARLLEPTNERIQARIAMLDANSTLPEMRAAAVRTLQALAGGSTREAGFALRTLAVTDPRLVDPAVARAAGEEIVRRTASTADELLAALPALESSASPLLEGARQRLTALAGSEPAATLSIARWFYARGRYREAGAALATRPGAPGENLDVAMLQADVWFALGEARLVAETLARQEWSRYDLLREAILLRALELTGQSLPVLAARWDGVLKNLPADPDIAMAVATLADRWGRPREALAAWRIVARSSAARLRVHAQRQIFELCLRERQTADLLAAARDLSHEFPADHRMRNNVAYLQLLLNVNTDRAAAIADELAQAHPADAHILSTRAFQLWRQRRLGEARRLLAEAQVRFAEAPEFAFVRTLVAATEGHASAATLAAQLQTRRPLLPEESTLLQDALRGLHPAPARRELASTR
ncbi:MAG: hypothetical protein JSR82_05420 [Verrucomicrobia bacterium]|nr:hypothetical protein [Verrucomicrobiota bacterium]